MKKYLAMLCATMLCVCCLGLAACGGNASSSAAASGSSASASASASSSAADPTAVFVSTWKLAAIESQGITMAGDLAAMLGENATMGLVIEDNGKGVMTMGTESADFTWVAKDDSTITITPVAKSDSSDSSASASASSTSTTLTSVDVTYVEGALFMEMSQDSFTGSAIFTADGTFGGAKLIDTAAAKNITSEDALVGKWTLCGMNMMGISMYGPADALASLAGDTDVTVTFEKGGKVNLMGQEATYTVGADGATVDMSGVKVPVKDLDGDIVIDLTDALGMDMAMVFEK